MDILEQLALDKDLCAAGGGSQLWKKDSNGKMPSVNPTNGQTIAQVDTCTSAAYDDIVNKAQLAFNQWRQVPAPKRGELIRRIGELMREQKDQLGSLIALEMGKIKAEGDGEVQEAIDMAEFAVGQSRMLYGKTMHSERLQHRMYEQWHPYGVIGVITAFNFPMAVWAWNAFIAAIAGNTVVWKPSSKTPLCAIALQHLCNQAMDDLGYESIFSYFISPGAELGDRFVKDERVPLISFTGSCAKGQYVKQEVAKRMGRSLLELGGNNALIVDETANLDLALPAIVFGAVGTAGQRCTTTRRLLVHKSIATDMETRLSHAFKQVVIGDPLNPKTLMGPLIDPASVSAYEQAIAEIKQQDSLICGGTVMSGEGFFVEPSLARADNNWPLVQRETFAPILYLIPYATLDEAIDMNNAVQQGLSSALFTTNIHHAEQFLSAMGSDCGIANINIGTSGAEIGGAFGGEKHTGGGREAGSDAWQAYMRRQTNTINWGHHLPLAQGIKFDLPT